jgi:hypothetical protein
MNTESSADWRDKANRLIAAACRQSQLQANTKPDGTRYKKHRPYSVPAVAKNLIDCLNADDEHRAKSLYLYDYDTQQMDARR